MPTPLTPDPSLNPQPTHRVSLIGAPTDVGASRLGAAMGPDALRVAQLPAALRALGVDVVDTGNLAGPVNPRGGRDPKAAGLRNLPEAVFWTQAVHDAVLAQLQEGRTPIMLGVTIILQRVRSVRWRGIAARRGASCGCCGWMRIRTAIRRIFLPVAIFTGFRWPICWVWGRSR